jgi:hypothetical protein
MYEERGKAISDEKMEKTNGINIFFYAECRA